MRAENTKATRGVIIPSYNSGPLLLQTLRSVLEVCGDVIVAVDGSTDGSDRGLEGLGGGRVRVVRLLKNSGKGAAFLEAARLALSLGWSHAAVVDADGQHEVSDIPRFFALSRRYPGAMVLGQPVFGDDAPWVRVVWRRVGNWLTRLETLWGWAGDSLFGFRVYPLEASVRILDAIRGGRGFDFDTELVVRLYWEGWRPVNLSTRVRYLPGSAGGVSHFRYLRDNVLLLKAHCALVAGACVRFSELLRLRRRFAREREEVGD